MVPTVHMNVRMIAAGHPGEAAVCWFGGGMDLTPSYYGFEEDAVAFHRARHDAHGSAVWRRAVSRVSSTWCDDISTWKHRNGQRGVGGIRDPIGWWRVAAKAAP